MKQIGLEAGLLSQWLGSALLDVVRRGVRGDTLTDTKAAKVLGVKPGLVEPLLRNFESSRGLPSQYRG